MENRINILIVEDDIASQKLAAAILKNIAITTIVDNGLTAIETVKNGKFDLIILDVNLGLGMNGIETLNLIREIPEYKDTPVIAITAYAMHRDKEEFLAKGFTYYLAKPYIKDDLLNIVSNYTD